MSHNPQLELAHNFVCLTDKNVFLTGKAGTGKTTFLHNLKKSSPKRMAVVAPTGVAAINAGGVTINSFFQIPFSPFVPNDTEQQHKRFHREKLNLIKSLDLLVIDEISMVRADTLDSIDEILRRYRDRTKPFGGLQLLMIGDLHQLSPVVTENDWRILRDYYPNMYFFNSKALQQSVPVTIELKKIYRQSDTTFIDLLNRVRENKIDSDVLEALNGRYIPDFKPSDDEGYITLTTHNNTAAQINATKLAGIAGKLHKFKATIKGDFPEYSYPTAVELELKEGAQVMFVKNDPSREKLYYNGKIGAVTRITDNTIFVKCPNENELAVTEQFWDNLKFELNTETKEVEEKTIGSFSQFPLKLAWAITIHKSQGLTFERAIIDANAAFAHGQVYVALSRCKSFEGLVLRSKIETGSVKTDGNVSAYSKNAEANAPDEDHLAKSKIAFQQSLIFELFDFNSVKYRLFAGRKFIEDNYSSFNQNLLEQFNTLKANAEKDIYAVADSFKTHLPKYFTTGIPPEENEELAERLQKAAVYFVEKIESLLEHPLSAMDIDSDNKAARTGIKEATTNLKKELFIKTATLKLCRSGFNTIAYLQCKANAEIDFEAKTTFQKPAVATLATDIPHPDLYLQLKKWRNNLASENNVPVYQILPQKSLGELVALLPTTPAELETVKGIGRVKVKQYGPEILKMIAAYCEKNNITGALLNLPVQEKKEKIDTKKVSLDLFKEGKAIPEIAQLRNFTPATIEGHLAHYIPAGEVSVFDIVDQKKAGKIISYLTENPNIPFGQAKAALGDDISYGEIKAVVAHLAMLNTA